MSPHDPERISLYLDGELSPAEGREVEEHLTGCARCRATYEAFVQLRTLLQEEAEPVRPIDQLAERRALREILRDRPPAPLWRRPVTLPASGLAALVALLVVALGVLGLERLPFGRGDRASVEGEVHAGAVRGTAPEGYSPSHEASESEGAGNGATHDGRAEPAAFDPARFDRGGRLETYIAIHPQDEED